MNKKGFTLIELLAVIVILAIIAIIATPIVLNIIKDASESAAKESATAYIKAVEQGYLTKLTKNEKIENGDYTIPALDELGVKVKGNKPSGENDYVTLQEGKVIEYELTIKEYIITYKDGNTIISSADSKLLDNTVTFMSDGKPYEIVSVKSGNPVSFPLVDPVSDTGVFAGWKIDGVEGYISFPYLPTGDIEINAIYQTVRKELEINKVGDNVSSSMGTKTNDGLAIYGLSYETNSISGTWYTGYLISKEENAVLTSNLTNAYTVTYNEQTWYYSSRRTTNSKTTYTDGKVEPYFVGKLSGSSAITAILDYYFYQS